jgi:uncharacterized protein YlzI (FlbEa/FlbD family)
MLINFKTVDVQRIAINPEKVEMIQEFSDDLTTVIIGGSKYTVRGGFDIVLSTLSPKPHISIETIL